MRFAFLFLLLGFINPVYADSSDSAEKESVRLAKAPHLRAIGAVFAGKNEYSGNYSTGTGTYVGNKRVVTAAHVVADLYFGKVTDGSKVYHKHVGPVVLDTTKMGVYWSPVESLDQGDDFNNSYKVLKIIVDAEYLKRTKVNKKSLSDVETVSDIAILVLDRSPSVNPIPIAQRISVLPDVGVLVGFGRRNSPRYDGKKHALVQSIEEEEEIKGKGNLIPGNWNMLLSDVEIQGLAKIVQKDPNKALSIKKIFGLEELKDNNIIISIATNGDSGGPLLAYNRSTGEIKVVGVLSSSSDNGYNEYASLVVESGGGFIRTPEVNKMLVASGQSPSPGPQKPKRADPKLSDLPRLKAELNTLQQRYQRAFNAQERQAIAADLEWVREWVKKLNAQSATGQRPTGKSTPSQQKPNYDAMNLPQLEAALKQLQLKYKLATGAEERSVVGVDLEKVRNLVKQRNAGTAPKKENLNDLLAKLEKLRSAYSAEKNAVKKWQIGEQMNAVRDRVTEIRGY